MTTLLPPWPYYDQKQINEASKVLESGKVNYWTGNKSKLFEKKFADFVGTKYAIAVSNGTVALYLAYLACGLSKGDEIITTPRTYIATASTAILFGAIPVFADVDLDTGNIKFDEIKKLVSPKTKIISVVHLAGCPAEILAIRDFASKNNILLVEDCSQAHGAKVLIDKKFKSVGSFGDVSTWSFCQDKIISTGGEGGMVTTNNKNIYELIWSYKDHGKDINKVNSSSKKPGFKWMHKNMGNNFRITEFQSSIGICQLDLIKEWNQKRNQNAQILIEALEDLKIIRIPSLPKNIIHAWYKFYCFLNLNFLSDKYSRDEIVKDIEMQGYSAFHGGCSEIYLEEIFQSYSKNYKKRLPNSKQLGETSLMFLVHPTIDLLKMKSYAKVIRNVLIKASKSSN
tara:strand:- start:229 stop:1422 length:1194 start_codon:yes stop_codon:yes gene_type:complete